MAALNKFISKLGEHNLSFFKTLKNITNFEWTPKCQKVFEELKVQLSTLKILSQLRENKGLLLYFGVFDQTVSLILVIEEEGVQYLVYYSN